MTIEDLINCKIDHQPRSIIFENNKGSDYYLCVYKKDYWSNSYSKYKIIKQISIQFNINNGFATYKYFQDWAGSVK